MKPTHRSRGGISKRETTARRKILLGADSGGQAVPGDRKREARLDVSFAVTSRSPEERQRLGPTNLTTFRVWRQVSVRGHMSSTDSDGHTFVHAVVERRAPDIVRGFPLVAVTHVWTGIAQDPTPDECRTLFECMRAAMDSCGASEFVIDEEVPLWSD